MTPRRLQDGPRRPKMAPSLPKIAPRRLQDGPKMAQDGSKTAPRWPKMAPRRPQDGSLFSWALSGLKATNKQAKSKHLRWSTSVSVRFFAPLRRFPLLRNKFWGAAACPPQAFSIRPLPGFSLGAVLRLFCPTRLSQSVQVCQISTEFSPRNPAHSDSPGRFLGSSAILGIPKLIQKCVPFWVPFWTNFGSQNGSQNCPTTCPTIHKFGVHFLIALF